MRFIKKLLLTFAITWLVGLYSFFWVVAILVVLLNILYKTNFWSSAISGFLGMGLIWAAFSYYFAIDTGMIINQRISILFNLGAFEMHLISGLVAGVLGFISAFAGYSLQQMWKKRPQNLYGS